MKKVLTLLALAAMVGFVSCKKDPKPEPQPEPAKAVTATITANDVTVDEGSTVKIGATTNSSAAITYSSDNTAVATVSSSGEVTGCRILKSSPSPERFSISFSDSAEGYPRLSLIRNRSI